MYNIEEINRFESNIARDNAAAGFTTKRMTCDQFIRYHNARFKAYCEIIIFPNGTIQYAIPSHQHALLQVYADKIGYHRVDNGLWELISPMDFGFEWLLKETRCVSVWWSNIAFNTITDKQFDTLVKLSESGCIRKDMITMPKN